MTRQPADGGGPDLGVRIGSLRLAHPVMTASGTCGYLEELEPFFSPSVLAAVVGKSISLEPREGNEPPRMAETPAGMLNSIGLQNPGLERYLAHHLPRMRRYGVPVVTNIVGRSVDEFARLAERLDREPGVAALELNLSCPNVAEGGMSFSASPEACEAVCRAVRGATGLPVFAKLTPNVTDVVAIGQAAQAGGADAVTAINTLLGLAVRWRSRTAALGRGAGGLSGPAIKPVALRIVAQLARALTIPVIGVGGIAGVDDVLEFIVAGASAVQIGTAIFADPLLLPRVIEALPQRLLEAGLDSIERLRGTLELA